MTTPISGTVESIVKEFRGEMSKDSNDWLREVLTNHLNHIIDEIEAERLQFRVGGNEADVAYVKSSGALRYVGEGASDKAKYHNESLDKAIKIIRGRLAD